MLYDLPTELVLDISEYLDLEDKWSLRRTSTWFNKIILPSLVSAARIVMGDIRLPDDEVMKKRDCLVHIDSDNIDRVLDSDPLLWKRVRNLDLLIGRMQTTDLLAFTKLLQIIFSTTIWEMQVAVWFRPGIQPQCYSQLAISLGLLFERHHQTSLRVLKVGKVKPPPKSNRDISYGTEMILSKLMVKGGDMTISRKAMSQLIMLNCTLPEQTLRNLRVDVPSSNGFKDLPGLDGRSSSALFRRIKAPYLRLEWAVSINGLGVNLLRSVQVITLSYSEVKNLTARMIGAFANLHTILCSTNKKFPSLKTSQPGSFQIVISHLEEQGRLSGAMGLSAIAAELPNANIVVQNYRRFKGAPDWGEIWLAVTRMDRTILPLPAVQTLPTQVINKLCIKELVLENSSSRIDTSIDERIDVLARKCPMLEMIRVVVIGVKCRQVTKLPHKHHFWGTYGCWDFELDLIRSQPRYLAPEWTCTHSYTFPLTVPSEPHFEYLKGLLNDLTTEG